MPPFKPARKAPSLPSWGLTRLGNPTDFPVPSPPPMQTLRTGWWVARLREEETEK